MGEKAKKIGERRERESLGRDKDEGAFKAEKRNELA